MDQSCPLEPSTLVMDEKFVKVGESPSATTLVRQKNVDSDAEVQSKNGPPLPTKVVLRYLPPMMMLEDFMELISPLPEIPRQSTFKYYINFEPVDPDDQELDHIDDGDDGDENNPCMSTATGHVNFMCNEDALSFIYKYNNYKFNTPMGNFQIWADFAISQQIPAKHSARNSLENTYRQNEDYLKFKEAFKAGQVGKKSKFSNGDEMSTHVLQELAEREATKGQRQAPLVTHLISILDRQAKAKLEQEKKRAEEAEKIRLEKEKQKRLQEELKLQAEERKRKFEEKKKKFEERKKKMEEAKRCEEHRKKKLEEERKRLQEEKKKKGDEERKQRIEKKHKEMLTRARLQEFRNNEQKLVAVIVVSETNVDKPDVLQEAEAEGGLQQKPKAVVNRGSRKSRPAKNIQQQPDFYKSPKLKVIEDENTPDPDADDNQERDCRKNRKSSGKRLSNGPASSAARKFKPER